MSEPDPEPKALSDRQEDLQKVLLGQDELGMVIRAHINIENELIGFIRSRMSPPGALDALELDYIGRIKLAGGLGMNKDLRKALAAVGVLRNKFAHRLGAKIEADDAKKYLTHLNQQQENICFQLTKDQGNLRRI